MQVRAVLILGVTAVMTASVLPVYGEPPAGANPYNNAADAREVVLRSLGGANQSAAFSSVGILVAPGDIVTEAGADVRAGADKVKNGNAILLLGNVPGEDTFKKANGYMRNNPQGAIVDREGRLVPGSSVAALVRKNTSTGQEIVTTNPSVLEERYGIALDNPAGSQSDSPPQGSADPAYDTVIVETDYHGDTIVTITKSNGEMRRIHIIKDANAQ